jgi:hypothetical protein
MATQAPAATTAAAARAAPSFVLNRILNLMVKAQRSRWAGQGH